MNQAIEMLRAKATAMYELIAGENITLEIDPIEEAPAVRRDLSIEQFPTGDYRIEPTAQITQRTDLTSKMEHGLMDSANAKFDPCIAHLNWLFEMQGKVKVWIYNISQQEHTLSNGLIKRLRVPACKVDEEFAEVACIPAVMIHSTENVDSGEYNYVITDGRRVAMDLINPSNLSIDQDADCSWLNYTAVGNDFSKKGVFFSTHNPPLKKELKAAHKRLKKYYADLVERANIVRLTSAAGALCVTYKEIEAAQEYVGITR